MKKPNIIKLWILPFNNNNNTKLVSDYEKKVSKNLSLKDLRNLFIQGVV